MANRRTEIRSSNRFSFLGLQITVDSDCSYEIKRHLFLGRKAMTNLDSILKNRDIILPTNIHVIKAMVFPSVMNGCESWTINTTEHQRIVAFKFWCWRRLLRVTWTARRSDQSILKEISPEFSLKGLLLKLKLQYFGHLKCRVNSLAKIWCWERLKAKGAGGGRRWIYWIALIELTEMNLSKVWEIVEDKEAWHAAVHGVTKSQTWLSD